MAQWWGMHKCGGWCGKFRLWTDGLTYTMMFITWYMHAWCRGCASYWGAVYTICKLKIILHTKNWKCVPMGRKLRNEWRTSKVLLPIGFIKQLSKIKCSSQMIHASPSLYSRIIHDRLPHVVWDIMKLSPCFCIHLHTHHVHDFAYIWVCNNYTHCP